MPPELVGALERAAPPRSGGRIAIRARGEIQSRRMGPNIGSTGRSRHGATREEARAGFWSPPTT